jgi:hypothetical protein
LDFHPAVRDEIRDAHSWYEQRRIGLGREFLDELERVLVGCGRPRVPDCGAGCQGRVRPQAIHTFGRSADFLVFSWFNVALVISPAQEDVIDESDLVSIRH